MITFNEAFDLVMAQARPLPSERVPLMEALNRVLEEDIASDMDMPPFNKSAMDGFACRREDLTNPLHVVESIQAGQSPTRSIGPNECARIMTGAPTPHGADCVIMIEYTEAIDEDTIRFTGKSTRDNICIQGEDIQTGDIVLEKGVLLGPQHIAILATTGHASPLVAKQPAVGIIGTGDELVEPETKPGTSQIRNSNSFQLYAQTEQATACPRYYGIAPDTEEGTSALLKQAMDENDVVILSGGVSMGDYDLVPDVMRKNGLRILFEEIAIKPGRPTHFGVSDSVYCFALPGNPVSTFIQFEILIKPFLHHLMGHEFQATFSQLPMARSFSRKRAGREAWLPVYRNAQGQVETIDYHGSAHINAMGQANGFITVPMGVEIIEEGTLVHVRHF